MFGYLCGLSDTSFINYCPACGERVAIAFSDGTVKCDECGLRFGVIEVNDEDEEKEE